MPTINEVNHTISNMKNVVDGQELRIQRNMMEIEMEQLCMEDALVKKMSAKTDTTHHIWEDYSGDHIGEDWAWHSDNVFGSSAEL